MASLRRDGKDPNEIRPPLHRHCRAGGRHTRHRVRHITYLAGGAGNQPGEGVDDHCGGEYEGKVRLERARNYWRYIQMFPEWRANVRTAIVPGIGHAGGDMIRSDTFVKIAFGSAR